MGGAATHDFALCVMSAIIDYYLRIRDRSDYLLIVVCPEQPYYKNPVTHKSLAPVIFYETKHPRQGLLYSSATRWPGFVTAADFAPTVLDWWGIPVDTPNETMDGRVLQVRPGGPADLDRLDRTLSDHFRWSFVAAPIYMAYSLLLVIFSLIATFRRPRWWPWVLLPALAYPLVPASCLLAHLTGAPHLWEFLVLGFGFAFAIAILARAAVRVQPAPLTLAIAMLAGAAVMAADTLTGNWLTRVASFSPPPLIGGRFYGLENTHMGFFVGLTVVGLAALWEYRPRLGGLVAVLSAAVVLIDLRALLGSELGRRNHGGLRPVPVLDAGGGRRWWRAIPLGAGLLAVTAFLPGLLDLLLSPSSKGQTHIGAATALLFSHHGDMLRDITERKLTAMWGILRYTPWTMVLAMGALAAGWALLRRGGPVSRALGGQPKLAAGIAAVLVGGVVSSLVNDSCVAAGAGLWCAGLGASLYVAARPAEAAE